MYNMYGFGKRIAMCRKLVDLTQEELASRLNITAQAISKWENELSFPEITVLPLLAKELNTSIEKLFGSEKDMAAVTTEIERYKSLFPEKKAENFNLVHIFNEVACYSEKDVEVTNEDTVVFKDGSSANLRQLKIVNKGAGEICFEFGENMSLFRNPDLAKTELNQVFDKIDSIEISANDARYKVVRSSDNKTHVKAKGSPLFIDSLAVSRIEGFLTISLNPRGNNNGSFGDNNNVLIEFGSDSGKNLVAAVNGCGDIEVQVPFDKGKAKINGSGEIKFTDIGDFGATINGSGSIYCGHAGNPDIKINGSGDVTIKGVSGSFVAKINGSGDITTGPGELDKFEAKINGSGDINARGVETRFADLAIEGSSQITIGRVIDESIEKHSKKSVIKVLKRG